MKSKESGRSMQCWGSSSYSEFVRSGEGERYDAGARTAWWWRYGGARDCGGKVQLPRHSSGEPNGEDRGGGEKREEGVRGSGDDREGGGASLIAVQIGSVVVTQTGQPFAVVFGSILAGGSATADGAGSAGDKDGTAGGLRVHWFGQPADEARVALARRKGRLRGHDEGCRVVAVHNDVDAHLARRQPCARAGVASRRGGPGLVLGQQTAVLALLHLRHVAVEAGKGKRTYQPQLVNDRSQELRCRRLRLRNHTLLLAQLLPALLAEEHEMRCGNVIVTPSAGVTHEVILLCRSSLRRKLLLQLLDSVAHDIQEHLVINMPEGVVRRGPVALLPHRLLCCWFRFEDTFIPFIPHFKVHNAVPLEEMERL
mmetsp:Transcript_24337/g.68192  ORF Transcript_24337/g.68192 Transcript_24337/m.68192 type:complete len:369 (-) Transcript_24337:580-1686(-)